VTVLDHLLVAGSRWNSLRALHPEVFSEVEQRSKGWGAE
jgi:hypothetical protein